MPTIEHVVLFKIKEGTEQSKVNAMVDRLNSLVSLDQVVHLTAGPVLRTRSYLSDFTLMLHSRYKSKEDLAAYITHPDHQAVVKETTPLYEDIMAVDWVADHDPDPLVLPPGSVVKVTFLKLKENVTNEAKGEILEGMKEMVSGIQEMTFGENFSGRAKGFSVASIAVFPWMAEMEAAEEFMSLNKEKGRDSVESIMTVVYVIPSSSGP